LPSYEQWHLDVLTHGDLDDYWRRPGYGPELFYDQHADVPTVYFGGWYDSYARSTCLNFVELSQRKRSPQYLIMGPWTHGTRSAELSYAGDVDFGREAAIDSMNELRLVWFDCWLKGLATGAEKAPRVRIFVMGGGSGRRNAEGRLDHGGTWRDEQAWPLARTRFTPYYLHPDGLLSPEKPAVRAASTSFTFDPAHPVPTIGGNLSAGEPVLIAGAYDQRGDPRFFGCEDTLPLAARPDVLVFQTPLLAQDLEVAGPLTVHLWVSSSAVDTDITVKLLDVYPPNGDYPEGFALNLTDSILRLRYRNSREQPENLTPGQPTPIIIEMYPTSNRFLAGHRLRLDISSSNFPRFDVNPNTGEPLGYHTRLEKAHNTIYHDADHPSHVLLPVIPG
jgi:putative CocE/NonD family hydrolase